MGSLGLAPPTGVDGTLALGPPIVAVDVEATPASTMAACTAAARMSRLLAGPRGAGDFSDGWGADEGALVATELGSTPMIKGAGAPNMEENIRADIFSVKGVGAGAAGAGGTSRSGSDVGLLGVVVVAWEAAGPLEESEMEGNEAFGMEASMEGAWERKSEFASISFVFPSSMPSCALRRAVL